MHVEWGRVIAALTPCWLTPTSPPCVQNQNQSPRKWKCHLTPASAANSPYSQIDLTMPQIKLAGTSAATEWFFMMIPWCGSGPGPRVYVGGWQYVFCCSLFRGLQEEGTPQQTPQDHTVLALCQASSELDQVCLNAVDKLCCIICVPVLEKIQHFSR